MDGGGRKGIEAGAARDGRGGGGAALALARGDKGRLGSCADLEGMGELVENGEEG